MIDIHIEYTQIWAVEKRSDVALAQTFGIVKCCHWESSVLGFCQNDEGSTNRKVCILYCSGFEEHCCSHLNIALKAMCTIYTHPLPFRLLSVLCDQHIYEQVWKQRTPSMIYDFYWTMNCVNFWWQQDLAPGIQHKANMLLCFQRNCWHVVSVYLTFTHPWVCWF